MSLIRSSFLTLSAIGLVAALAGCGGNERPEAAAPGVQQPQGDLQNLPKWVLNPNYDEKYTIAAAGVARATIGGLPQQMTFAEQDGRTRIGQAIESQVKALVEQFYSQGGEPGGAERADEVRRTISQNVTNVAASGIMRIDLYRDKSDGSLFVWMVIDPKRQNEIASQIAKVAAKAAADRAQVKAELKADEMVGRLEQAINAKLGAQNAAAAGK
jgi:hypothetical protein